MNIVIFSKNRACQLELLLRSMMDKFYNKMEDPRVVVIYTHDDGFSDGYNKVIDAHRDHVHFVNEKTSAQPFNRMVYLFGLNDSHKYSMFLVDDDVFINSVSVDEKKLDAIFNNSDVVCHSLRMNPSINYCYTGNTPSPRPESFDEKSNTWQWKGGIGDWGYPCSVDGHIFRTEEIKPYINSLRFKNPNNMEGQMHLNWNLPGSMMSCESESVIVNVPANMVQTQGHNRHGSISVGYLENVFTSSEKISMESFKGLKITAPHMEVDYIMEPQDA